MKQLSFLICTLLVSLSLQLQAEEKQKTPLEIPKGSAEILPPKARLSELWNEGEFTEGVAVAPDGKIYFSDIAFVKRKTGRIVEFDPTTGKTRDYASNSLQSNGLMFDRKGRLLAACGAHGGARGLCEVKPNGTIQPLLQKFKNKRFHSLNDLSIHPNGDVYFSDPRYLGAEPMEFQEMSVYRYRPEDGSVTRVTTDIEKPNGIGISPDGKTLYVAETNNGSTDVVKKPTKPEERGRMTLNAFPILKDGSLGNKHLLVDFARGPGVDGMTLDIKGNIYAAVRADDRHGIRVYSPQGKELAFLPTKELPTNCCFGRKEQQKTLYITAGTGLYCIELKIPGFHPATAPR